MTQPAAAEDKRELGLLGNDIVDLGDPDNLASFERPGYVERVCAAAERRTLAAAADPRRLFFGYFAAKEAAYKLLVKLGEEPGFSHRRIEISPDLSWARYGHHEIALELASSDAFVHVLARVGPTTPRVEIAEIEEHARASAAGRELLCRLAAEVTGLARGDLSVERRPSASSWDGFEPPRLFSEGAPTGFDVSLSHDGRFVAAALALPLTRSAAPTPAFSSRDTRPPAARS